MTLNLRPYSGAEHQPFEMGDGKSGFLLLHGFTGTPAEVRGLGETLAQLGWHSHAPLLPGFGSDIVNLDQRRRADWLDAARDVWEKLHHRYQPSVLFGYSMGGAIAIHLACELSPDILVLAAPFWRMPGWMPRLIPAARIFTPHMRPFKKADFSDVRLRREFERIMPGIDLDDSEVQESIRAEFTLPLTALHEAMKLGSSAYKLAKRVQCPVLVLQGEQDTIVRSDQTRKLFRRIGSPRKSYQSIPTGHDLLMAGTPQLEQTVNTVLGFIESIR